ncbi:MAG: PilZ domain-containing protein [Oligoflexia bacterium]|nr:PilZ domain-containing protein [Oligoflexia bacterium]
MKEKPLSISIIAWAYLLAPLGNIIQVAWINNWPYFGPRSVFHHFSNYEWLLLACFPIVAYGIHSVAKWGYFAFLACSAYLLLQNTFMYIKNPAYSIYIVVLFHLVTIGCVGFFLQKHIISPYFNPNLKWWERDTRFNVNLGAQMRIRQIMIDCNVLDISKKGCYVDMKARLDLGDMVWINLSLGPIQFSVLSKVMWHRAVEPTGYGLMFMGLAKEDTKNIKKMIDYLHKSVDHGLQKSDGIKSA